ncbi:DUF1351 domain-containing protein, partial [Hespellia stercorisuis]
MNQLALRVNQNPGTIELNFEELNKQLDTKLAEYKGAVFTEETKDIAKGEVAGLRRLKKEIDEARKATKKKWMEPCDAFEEQMKNLTKKIDEPIQLIDDQVKEFDAKKKAEKRVQCRKIYDEIIGDMGRYLPFEKIFNPKWENVSTSIKTIREEISKYVEDARITIDAIKAMQSEKESEAIEVYVDTLSMAKAIDVINLYERQKAEILVREEERRKQEEERRLQAEIARAKAEERAAIAREEQIKNEVKQEMQQQVAQPEEELEVLKEPAFLQGEDVD